MSNRTSQLYDFGPYRLDLARRVFTREGRVVPLAPKTFELLHLLVESAGRAFSKQELMAALWPETFVEEANLSFQISVLRKALGEGGAQLIETVPKHGYRFTADVKAVAPAGETPAASAEVASVPTSAEVRTRRRGATWLVAVGAASVIATVFYVVGFNRTPAGTPTVAVGSATPLTSYPGMEGAPSLSPDGSQVAFSWNGEAEDNFDIYVKLVGPGQPWRLTANPARDETPSWSPDGRFIAFHRQVNESTADLIVIPALGGGVERRLTTVVMLVGSHTPLVSTLAWTPDARWIAFSGRPSEDQTVRHMADRDRPSRDSAPHGESNGVERRFQPRVLPGWTSSRVHPRNNSLAECCLCLAGLGRADRDFSAITRHTGTLRLSRRCMDAGRRRSSALVRRASGIVAHAEDGTWADTARALW